MKLIPFNLEKALKGAKVVTRDGQEVKQLTMFETDSRYCLVGVVNSRIMHWTKEGLVTIDRNEPNSLLLEVETKRIYVNVIQFNNGELDIIDHKFDTFEAAQNFAKHSNQKTYKKNFLKTIEITDEI